VGRVRFYNDQTQGDALTPLLFNFLIRHYEGSGKRGGGGRNSKQRDTSATAVL
jgi:hypothetical protein